MMKQQPDNLFRKKLTDYDRPVPADAWSRIEAGLNGQKKKTFFPYLRIAAAILLMAVVSYMILTTTDDSAGQIAKVENTSPGKSSDSKTSDTGPDTSGNAAADLPLAAESPAAAQTDSSEESSTSATAPAPTARTHTKNRPSDMEASHAQTVDRQRQDMPAPVQTSTSEKSLFPEVTVATVSTSAQSSAVTHSDEVVAENDASIDSRESITLVMTVSDTDAYLKKTPEEEATSGSRKTSTLKRVLQKASELKNNDQDPFGDLRQMKNEILALNFKSEKQRGPKQLNQ